MRKTTQKTFFIATLFFIIFSLFSNVFATDTTLEIIQKSSENKYLENDQGYVSKSIVDSNNSTGEVTIELKLSNTKKELENKKDSEIFLVVDNSPSMDFVTSTGKTRKELILNSATQLVTSIFNNSNNVKIGLIDFHGENGWFEYASISNATVRLPLTNNKDSVLSAIENQLQRETVGGTNIDAGLQVAKRNFSDTSNNKIIILLTDGIPNADVNGTDPDAPNDVTDPDCIKIGENTKNTLLKLKESGIYTITLLTGMSESDGNTDKSGTIYPNPNTLEEQLEAAKNIFGTPANPTADRYYLVNNLDINKIITEDIFKDVSKIIQNPLNSVKIIDYFPKDITDNFEFSYLSKPSLGTISDTIDIESKTITWDIETLKGNEIATLQYKLKLKNMNNDTLLNKTISTNDKVLLTYEDVNSQSYIVTLSDSPKIKLSTVVQEFQNEENENTTNKKTDPTTAKGTIPYTGMFGITLAVIVLISSGIIAYKKYNNLKGI